MKFFLLALLVVVSSQAFAITKEACRLNPLLDKVEIIDGSAVQGREAYKEIQDAVTKKSKDVKPMTDAYGVIRGYQLWISEFEENDAAQRKDECDPIHGAQLSRICTTGEIAKKAFCQTQCSFSRRDIDCR